MFVMYVIVASMVLVGISDTASSLSYRLVFPSEPHSASVNVVDTIPKALNTFTICFSILPSNWTYEDSARAVFSYSTPGFPDDVLIAFDPYRVIFFRRQKSVSFNVTSDRWLHPGNWNHVCLTSFIYENEVQLYSNGKFSGRGYLDPNHQLSPLPPAGQITLGNSRVHKNESLSLEPWRGEIMEVHIWDKSLCQNEISHVFKTYNNLTTIEGNMLSWSRITAIPTHGAAITSAIHLCDESDSII